MHAVEATPEQLLREAGRQRRSVKIRLELESGTETEREMEPYAITEDGVLIAFSYFRDEFRTVPLKEILGVRVTDKTFSPRRPVDL